MSDHLRILLDPATSDTLSATGEAVFLVVGKASHPADPTRWVVHIVPCPMATASAACEIALGQRKPGRRIQTPAQTPSQTPVQTLRE